MTLSIHHTWDVNTGHNTPSTHWRTSHVSYMNLSHVSNTNTEQAATPQIWMYHTYITQFKTTCRKMPTNSRMRHVKHMNVSHIWMSHVTHMNESSHTYETITHIPSDLSKKHPFIQTNKSCNKYECIAHTIEWCRNIISDQHATQRASRWMIHITSINASHTRTTNVTQYEIEIRPVAKLHAPRSLRSQWNWWKSIFDW